MENIKLYVAASVISIVMVTSAGFIAYFVLNSSFHDIIDKEITEFNGKLQQKLQNCSKITVPKEFYKANVNTIETDMKSWALENTLKCEENQFRCYITTYIGRKLDTLENGMFLSTLLYH